MPVVGTAGHVDHGKSTLVQALTGRDPDRWAEEKARGLTIDLGFAWATLPSGTEVSFVDVPGHERFMKNMLAGIEAIDVALLVVAADEGWMPQSEEHLAVLDVLGVDRAVVALTKSDRVDDELLELARLEVAERLEGTGLASAPVVAVSAITGAGVGDLASALDEAVGALPPPRLTAPRMWIDRSFTVAGAGTVVTGTLLEGEVAVGDQLSVWPADEPVRVRGVQSHEKKLDRVGPHRRVALNLGGVDADIARGSMLGVPGAWRPTRRFLAVARPARYVDELTDRGAYHLHLGSGAWPARVRILASIDRGVAVLVEVPGELALRAGDRFVLRETGRRMVVGGGRVLDPHPPRRRPATMAEALVKALDEGPDAVAAALLERRGSAEPAELAADSGGGRVAGGLELAGRLFTRSMRDQVLTAVRRQLADFHRDNPLRPGMPSASLASRVGVSTEVLAAMVTGDHGFVVDGAETRLVEHRVGYSEGQQAAWEAAEAVLREAGVAAAPRAGELGLERELLHSLVRDGRLVKISEDLVYLPEQTDALVASMRQLGDAFTVSEFKDRTGLSRKYAVPFLEWADRRGLTVRSGDTRRMV